MEDKNKETIPVTNINDLPKEGDAIDLTSNPVEPQAPLPETLIKDLDKVNPEEGQSNDKGHSKSKDTATDSLSWLDEAFSPDNLLS